MMKSAESTITWGILVGLFFRVFAEEEFPTVVTPGGSYQGYYKISNNGERYEAYEGIPYAKPPVGDLRFEPPKNLTLPSPHDKRTILIARELSFVCMQYDELQQKLHGSEDCLYLNIYRPNATRVKNTKLPVIFYIHGNDFQTGSGGENGPKYLLDNEVILVTFNYRLGPLGFLSTEDDVVPGNMGLKDQVIALRWVHRVIQHFHGDQQNIAIIGHGAGGASVHYHYLSEQSWGLFNKGMSMSGTALATWAQTKDSLKKARDLANIVGCPTEDITIMITCMKNQPADYLVQAIGVFRSYMKSPFAPFGPVVEKGNGPFTFIKESPSAAITSGKAQNLPWITSFVHFEGLAVASGFIVNENELERLNANWSVIAPHLLEFTTTVPQSSHASVAAMIKTHYFDEWPIAKWTFLPILNMIGDRLFVTDAAKAALLQAKSGKGPIRVYRFTHRGANSYSKITTGSSEFAGACHKDDLAYVFELPVNMSTTEGDRVVQKTMIDLWVSYAKDKVKGEPNIGVLWPQLKGNDNEITFLHILRPEERLIENSTNMGEMKFWDTLGIEENKIAAV